MYAPSACMLVKSSVDSSKKAYCWEVRSLVAFLKGKLYKLIAKLHSKQFSEKVK
jgi:hypothetical protein